MGCNYGISNMSGFVMDIGIDISIGNGNGLDCDSEIGCGAAWMIMKYWIVVIRNWYGYGYGLGY